MDVLNINIAKVQENIAKVQSRSNSPGVYFKSTENESNK